MIADILPGLPLPIAQVLRRALNAKSSVDRHHLAYFAGEAMLKLAASARVGVYVERCMESGSPLARQLEGLVLPSAGQWLGFLRDVSADLAKRPDAALLPLGGLDAELRSPHPEWTAVRAFVEEARDAGAISKETAARALQEGVLGFFSALVAYRNEVMAHGAQRQRAYYEKTGGLLLEALAEVLADRALLGGLDLAVARLSLSPDETESRLGWQLLRGLGSLPSPAADPGSADGKLNAACIPGQVYLTGSGARVPLHPLLVYAEDELGAERVGFLNRTVRRGGKGDAAEIRRVDYLDYAAGEALPGLDAREPVRRLLARLRGRDVADAELDGTIARTRLEPEEVPEEVVAPGALIGDYELMGELGRGGMGIVYRARQRSLNRAVALKVLPPLLASDPVTVARFRREIAALGRCDHPNVVKILASGVDADRYWYAMELVDGDDLYSLYDVLSSWRRDGAKLSGELLSAALASSAEARKRKAESEEAGPDGKAPARLPEMPPAEKSAPPEFPEDWRGYYKHLAELLSGACEGVQHLHDHGIVHRDIKPGNLMLTRDGKRVVLMDLGLAQVRDASVALTRTSTHILGTLRYMAPEQLQHKLLDVDHRADIYSLGASLYELACLKPVIDGDTEQELIRRKLQEEPVEPRKANREVPEDLAAVIETALQRKPEERYATASALAEDLKAFAESRPVKAKKFGRFHYLRLFIERNTALAYTTAAFILALIVILSGFTAWNLHERKKAEREAATAKQVSDFLVSIFKVSDPSEARGRAITAREILDKGSKKIDTELKDQPAVQSRMMLTTGMVYVSLGLYEEAEPPLTKALEIRERFLPPEDPDVAQALDSLADLYYREGQYEKAAPLDKRALAIREKALGPGDPEVASSLNNLAVLYCDEGQVAQAEPLYKRALAIREKALGPNDPKIAESLNNLAWLYREQGRYAQAEPLYKRSLAVYEKSLAPGDPELAFVLNNLAILYWDQGRYAEAEPLLKKVLTLREKALGPEHPDVAQTLNDLAVVYDDLGQSAQTEPLYKRALAIREKALGPDHPDVAQSLVNLAWFYNNVGEYAKAEPLFKRALAMDEKALGPSHPSVAACQSNLAKLYWHQGQYKQAETLYRKALTINEKALGPKHTAVASCLYSIACVYRDEGLCAEAKPLYERALAIREKAIGPDSRETAESLRALACCECDEKDFGNAVTHSNRSLDIGRRLAAKQPDDRSLRLLVASCLLLKGQIEASTGKNDEAQASWKEALSLLQPIAIDAQGVNERSVYAKVLLSLGKTDEARPIVKKLQDCGYTSAELSRLCREKGLTPK